MMRNQTPHAHSPSPYHYLSPCAKTLLLLLNILRVLVVDTEKEAESLNNKSGGGGGGGVAVVVDPYIARKLRPHQREGVRWMYRVLHGLEEGEEHANAARSKTSHGTGCLLADDMGLGKSLQSLALVWTMLRQGPRGMPTARRALLVCPASLVGSWGAEFNKWLGSVRAQAALAEGGGLEAAEAYEKWTRGAPPGTKSAFDHWPVLVTSYETLRRLAPIAAKAKPELLICDEAHRLRNAQQGSQTLAALRMVNVPRRVLLTGTPIQNNLDEYAAVMDFACPGLLGPIGDFHRRFTAVVQRGGDPGATPSEVAAAREAARELAALTAGHVLRREASINAAHLPAKTEMVMFCRPTKMQRALYQEGASMVQGWAAGTNASSSAAPTAGGGSTAAALCAIGLLRQLANSVDQIVKTTSSVITTKKAIKVNEGSHDGEEDNADNARPTKKARVTSKGEVDVGGLSDGDDEEVDDGGTGGLNKDADHLRAKLCTLIPHSYRGGIEGSGKLAALKALLVQLSSLSPSSSLHMGNEGGGLERMVVVSGFSATLDLVANLCAELGLTTDRLDGRVPPDARCELVHNFNAGCGGRVMLLSCVAGGAGLNLVGANRLVLFDTSWNPAHDHQAMARVWRDGQTRPVTIYRMLAAGTVEEKVFQRQLLKHAEAVAAGVGGEGIGSGIGGSGGSGGSGSTRFTRDELSELVAFSEAPCPATLAAAGWEDSKDVVEDLLLRSAIDAEDSTVTAVVRLAGDGGRAKALAEAEKQVAEKVKARKKGIGRPKRLAFADLLSKAKNRGG